MTYAQLLPIYQQQTGKAGQDAEFNTWVQNLIDKSGSKTGIDGIPEGYVSAPAGAPAYQGGPAAAGTGMSGLLTPNASATTPQATANTTGGNYNQVQNSNQAGSFGTVGSTDTTQNQTTGGSTSTNQAGSQSQTSTGTSTTTPNDTLGFGSLLQGAAGSATANDAARNTFLTDLMQNGGTAFGSQVDQAVRQSLTGPQMTGAGDSARARAAGYAGAQIGRTNMDQRLGAAQQLAGPTSLGTLAASANPYIGSSSTNTGTSDLNSTMNNVANSTGFSNLVSKANEAQAGSTAAASSQAGAGQIPEGQPVKSGGCVLCTAGIELKLPGSRLHRVLRRVIAHKLHTQRSRFAAASRGYFLLFTPFARFLLVHRWIASLLWPLARAVVYEELRVSGQRLPFRVGAWLVHWTGHGVCALVGCLAKESHVTDPLILTIARRERILFEIGGDR